MDFFHLHFYKFYLKFEKQSQISLNLIDSNFKKFEESVFQRKKIENFFHTCTPKYLNFLFKGLMSPQGFDS